LAGVVDHLEQQAVVLVVAVGDWDGKIIFQ
jgi:hypothetical protein